jgi:hypothetical protein
VVAGWNAGSAVVGLATGVGELAACEVDGVDEALVTAVAVGAEVPEVALGVLFPLHAAASTTPATDTRIHNHFFINRLPPWPVVRPTRIG